MEHQDSFSIVGCIEDIINVFNDNLDLVATLELLIIIALVIIYLSKVSSLKEKISSLEKTLRDERYKRIEDRKSYNDQKDKWEKELKKVNFTPNNNIGNKTLQEMPLPKDFGMSQKNDLKLDQDVPATQSSNQNDTKAKNTREYKYMEPAIGGKFFRSKVSEEKASFRTWVEGDVRKYDFCGNVANALANLNATFDDSCDYEGKQNGATEIINVEPGILSDDLTIITKAKIRLQ